MDKRHYSATQLNMYQRCSAQWYFRYVEGKKVPPTGKMAQGRAYHKGLEANFVQKLTTRTDMPVDDVQDAFATAFDAEIQTADLSADERGTEGALKDAGIRVVSTYHTDMAPLIQPTAVEQPIQIDFQNVEYGVIGYIDLIDDQQVIHDHKLVGKSPSKDPTTGAYTIGAMEMLQGAIYCLAQQTTQVSFDYAVKTKTPKIVPVPATINAQQQQFVLGLLGHVDHAIQHGIFIPNRANIMCSRRQCGYWHDCEKKFGGRVAD